MTPAEQCAANLEALRVALALRAGKQQATPDERLVLLGYSGFGDTAVRRHAMSDDGDPLPALAALGLSSGAIASLRRSVLTSFYTPPDLCEAVWQVLRHLGLGELPQAPRILEPSAGTGAFVGTAPWPYDEAGCAGLLDPRRLLAVESDECAWLVLRALHPRVDARHSPFEALALPPLFDCAVGNVPFGDYRVADPRFPDRLCAPVHDYFVCRAVSLLRPGGVACLITSKATLDRRDPHARRWLAERADLLAAYRLPSGTFGGTAACADLLVLQRVGPWTEGARQDPGERAETTGTAGWRRPWAGIADQPCAAWVGLFPVDFAGPGGFPARDLVSSWFHDHPDHTLGEWCQDRLARERPDAAVRPRPGDQSPAAQVRALAQRLPAGALLLGAGGDRETASRTPAAPAADRAQDAQGGAQGWTPSCPQGFALQRLLRAVRALCGASGEGAERQRAALGRAYDAYRGKYGPVRRAEGRAHPLHAATRERWWPLLSGLETPDGGRGPVFREARIRSAAASRPETAADALYVVLDRQGELRDLQEVADLLNGHAP